MTMGLRGLAALAAVLLLSSNGVVAKILDKTWHFDEEELDSRMWTPETGRCADAERRQSPIKNKCRSI
jgi:hypothetical protein